MKGMIAAHSGMRYIVLLLLLVAIVNAILRLNSGEYSKRDKSINLFAMIFLHLQLVLGLVLYFMNLNIDNGKVAFVKEMMKTEILRFYTMEHALLMIVAIILITLGKRKAEKQETTAKKHQTILRYYGLGLIIIFAAIPWPFIYKVGAGYF